MNHRKIPIEVRLTIPKEISCVDFVRAAFTTWGKKAKVVRPPAIKPRMDTPSRAKSIFSLLNHHSLGYVYISHSAEIILRVEGGEKGSPQNLEI
jgi:hypothetical protein